MTERGRPRTARVPFEPLRRWLGRGEPASVRNAAKLLDVGVATVQCWIKQGVPLVQADAVCGRVGAHPSEVWRWFDEIEPSWAASAWLRRRRTQAVLESWRLRLDCVGVAGDIARRMFNETVA